MNTTLPECAICMSRQTQVDDRLVCTHNNSFCKKCIDDCASHNIYDCPLCKRAMNVERQTTIYISAPEVQTNQRTRTCIITYFIYYILVFMGCEFYRLMHKSTHTHVDAHTRVDAYNRSDVS